MCSSLLKMDLRTASYCLTFYFILPAIKQWLVNSFIHMECIWQTTLKYNQYKSKTSTFHLQFLNVIHPSSSTYRWAGWKRNTFWRKTDTSLFLSKHSGWTFWWFQGALRLEMIYYNPLSEYWVSHWGLLPEIQNTSRWPGGNRCPNTFRWHLAEVTRPQAFPDRDDRTSCFICKAEPGLRAEETHYSRLYLRDGPVNPEICLLAQLLYHSSSEQLSHLLLSAITHVKKHRDIWSFLLHTKTDLKPGRKLVLFLCALYIPWS